MYSIVVSTYPSLLALGLYSSQPLQTLEPQNDPPKEMCLPPPLRPAEPEQCLPPLSVCIGRTYSKSLHEMLTFISLRSIKLATRQIPPRKKLRPRYLATHQIPSRKSTGPGPDTDPTQGKTRAPILGPGFYPGGNSGPGTRAQIPWVPISLVPARAPRVLQSPPLYVTCNGCC